MSSTASKIMNLREVINTYGVDSADVIDKEHITSVLTGSPASDAAQIRSADAIPGSMTLFVPLRQACDLATISIGSHSSIDVKSFPDEIVIFAHSADSLSQTLSPQDLISPDTLRHAGLPSQRIGIACLQGNESIRYRLEPRTFRNVSAVTIHVVRSITAKDHTVINHVGFHGQLSAPVFSHPNVTVETSQIRAQPRLSPLTAPI